ncbi:MAG: OmpA family protein [Thermodesulfovibrionales bacterium]|nr:OmpA family protein [Thermodesulfovibrionales bacterium]
MNLGISGGWISPGNGSDSIIGKTSVGINLSNYISLDMSIINTFSRAGSVLLSLDCSLNFLPESRMTPFIVIGAGAGIIEKDDKTSTKGLLNAGGGFQYFFSDEMALRFDLRSYMLGGQTDLALAAGIVFYFDPAQKPEPSRLPEGIQSNELLQQERLITVKTKEQISKESRVERADRKTTEAKTLQEEPASEGGGEKIEVRDGGKEIEEKVLAKVLGKEESIPKAGAKEVLIEERDKGLNKKEVGSTEKIKQVPIHIAEEKFKKRENAFSEDSIKELSTGESKPETVTYSKLDKRRPSEDRKTEIYVPEDNLVVSSSRMPVRETEEVVNLEKGIEQRKADPERKDLKVSEDAEEKVEISVKRMPDLKKEVVGEGQKKNTPVAQEIFVDRKELKKAEIHEIKKNGTSYMLASKKKDLRKESKPEKKQKVYEKAKMYGEGMVSESRESVKEEDKAEDKDTLSDQKNEQKVILKNNSIEATVEFSIGETVLSLENKEILSEFISDLKERKYKRIIIEGHACAHGDRKTNLLISRKRAQSVKAFLLHHGIKKNISLRYYGEEKLKFKEIPTPQNINDPHVKANRRVSIIAYW